MSNAQHVKVVRIIFSHFFSFLSDSRFASFACGMTTRCFAALTLGPLLPLVPFGITFNFVTLLLSANVQLFEGLQGVNNVEQELIGTLLNSNYVLLVSPSFCEMFLM